MLAFLTWSSIITAVIVHEKRQERRERDRREREAEERRWELEREYERKRQEEENRKRGLERQEQLRQQRENELRIARLKEIERKKKLLEEEKKREEVNRKLNEIIEKTKKANIQWNNIKKEIISKYLLSIDYTSNLYNYIHDNISINYDKYINLCISSIAESFVYKRNIKRIFNNYLSKINSEDLQTKKQNYILIGKTGAGKSCLINYLLSLIGEKRAKEGETLDSETSTIKRYENDTDNFTLTDTIGIEATNEERCLENIEEMIKKRFDQCSKRIENNIHGIIYCIKSDDTRVERNERNLIKRLKDIYPKKGIKFIVALTHHINSLDKKIYNALKTEFKDTFDIFEVNSKEAKLDLGNKDLIIKEKGKEKIIDFINSNTEEAKSISLINYKHKKIQDLYILNYSYTKRKLIMELGNYSNQNYLNNILSRLLSDEIKINKLSEYQYVNELKAQSDQIRESFHKFFFPRSINELSDLLSNEKSKILDCNSPDNCVIIAEEEIKSIFINSGYSETSSIIFANFHKKLIEHLFNRIVEDLGK